MIFHCQQNKSDFTKKGHQITKIFYWLAPMSNVIMSLFQFTWKDYVMFVKFQFLALLTLKMSAKLIKFITDPTLYSGQRPYIIH